MELSEDQYINRYEKGEMRLLCSAAWPAVQFMWNKGWFPSIPVPEILDLPSNHQGITIGVYPEETVLKTATVLSEVSAFRANDGFVNVHMRRAIFLSLLSSKMPRKDWDSLLSLYINYEPRDEEISHKVEGWHPKNVELIQTFPSSGGVRDVVDVIYNPNIQKGRATIGIFPRDTYEPGFDFRWMNGELLVDNRGAWLKGIPQEQIFGYVNFSSVLALMEAIDGNLLKYVRDDVTFFRRVSLILNPNLRRENE